MTLAIEIGAAVLALLCTLALLWSRWPLWLRTALVLLVYAFDFLAYAAVQDIAGWPSPERLPERFQLLAAVIDEPAPRHPGAVYLWVHALEDGRPSALPRAYQLPYSRDLHALLNEGLKKTRQGISQLGTLEPGRQRRGGLSWLRPGQDEVQIKLRDLPKPQLPEK